MGLFHLCYKLLKWTVFHFRCVGTQRFNSALYFLKCFFCIIVVSNFGVKW